MPISPEQFMQNQITSACQKVCEDAKTVKRISDEFMTAYRQNRFSNLGRGGLDKMFKSYVDRAKKAD